MKCSILLPFSPGSCLCSCASNQARRKLFSPSRSRIFCFFHVVDRRERFTNHRRTSIANHILSNVLKLQDKKCISAYLFSIGLDDQDPSQWDDADLSHLVVPDADYPSDSEEEGEEEEEEEEDQRGEGGGSAATVSCLVVPDPVLDRNRV